mmetsp:Transcript_45023/g.96057  ORF Transcript_45023/g.96057 Transcript_45023/m.96057 type:complete len:341 (-) Transcript_45023:268-1290(-)
MRNLAATVPAELPVLLIDALHKLLGLGHCSLVALGTSARDAKLQGLGALLLTGALAVARAHAAETELGIGDLDDFLHVRALGTNDAARHLELFIVLDADEEATSILPHTPVPRGPLLRARPAAAVVEQGIATDTLGGRAGASLHWSWPCHPLTHRRPARRRCRRRWEAPVRQIGEGRHRRVGRRRSRRVSGFHPLDAQGAVESIENFPIQVVHGCLCIWEALERDHRAGTRFFDADLLHCPVATEHLVKVVLRELVLELHALHGDRDGRLHRRRHGGCSSIRRDAGEGHRRHAHRWQALLRCQALLQVLKHLHVGLRHRRVNLWHPWHLGRIRHRRRWRH